MKPKPFFPCNCTPLNYLVLCIDLYKCFSFAGSSWDNFHKYAIWLVTSRGIVWSPWISKKPAGTQERELLKCCIRLHRVYLHSSCLMAQSCQICWHIAKARENLAPWRAKCLYYVVGFSTIF